MSFSIIPSSFYRASTHTLSGRSWFAFRSVPNQIKLVWITYFNYYYFSCVFFRSILFFGSSSIHSLVLFRFGNNVEVIQFIISSARTNAYLFCIWVQFDSYLYANLTLVIIHLNDTCIPKSHTTFTLNLPLQRENKRATEQIQMEMVHFLITGGIFQFSAHFHAAPMTVTS